MQEFDKILDKNEIILWQGKPQFLPYFFSAFSVAFIGLIFMVAGALPLIQGIKEGNLVAIVFPHFWIGLAIFIGIPLYTALVYKNIYYAITNKRVLIQGGLIGRDFNFVDFDQITNADVNIGFLDKLVGRNSGSILISTAGTLTYSRQGPVQKPYTLRNISQPYEVFKFFKQISHDVKTDIEYPNKLRPTENPGYTTQYNPDNPDNPEQENKK